MVSATKIANGLMSTGVQYQVLNTHRALEEDNRLVLALYSVSDTHTCVTFIG